MQLGLVTYMWGAEWDLPTVIKNCQATGFKGVELRSGHKHGVEPSLGAAQRDKVRARFQKSKVRLLSFGSTCEFQSPDAETRRKQIEIGKQWVDLAHDTGAWGVKVRPNGIARGETVESTVPRVAQCLRELGDYGQGLRLLERTTLPCRMRTRFHRCWIPPGAREDPRRLQMRIVCVLQHPAIHTDG